MCFLQVPYFIKRFLPHGALPLCKLRSGKGVESAKHALSAPLTSVLTTPCSEKPLYEILQCCRKKNSNLLILSRCWGQKGAYIILGIVLLYLDFPYCTVLSVYDFPFFVAVPC